METFNPSLGPCLPSKPVLQLSRQNACMKHLQLAAAAAKKRARRPGVRRKHWRSGRCIIGPSRGAGEVKVPAEVQVHGPLAFSLQTVGMHSTKYGVLRTDGGRALFQAPLPKRLMELPTLLSRGDHALVLRTHSETPGDELGLIRRIIPLSSPAPPIKTSRLPPQAAAAAHPAHHHTATRHIHHSSASAPAVFGFGIVGRSPERRDNLGSV
jgi:hypothetical protein